MNTTGTTHHVTKAGKLHGSTKCTKCGLTSRQATKKYLHRWPDPPDAILVRLHHTTRLPICDECFYGEKS